MNTYTDTFTNVTLHFDDSEASFPALQDRNGCAFITEDTFVSLKAQGFNMEDATIALHPAEYAGLRDISDFPINFEFDEPLESYEVAAPTHIPAVLVETDHPERN